MPYRETWIERANHPQHLAKHPDETMHRGRGSNPTCGDELTVYMEPKDGRIIRAEYAGVCCAVCKASAETLCDEVRDLSIPEAKAVVGAFRGALWRQESGEGLFRSELAPELCDVAVVLPSRARCADLAWRIAEGVLEGMG